jgi:hypothetical protein
MPKYDTETVEIILNGPDGNSFSIIGKVSLALKRAGAPPTEVKEYQKKSMAGDYQHLLDTAAEWANFDAHSIWR